MARQSLDERVTWLEQQMNKLLAQRGRSEEPADVDEVHRVPIAAREPAPDDWQSTVGMFRGDPVFQEMVEETTRRREQERRQAREESERDSA